MGVVQKGVVTSLDGRTHWATTDDEGTLTVWDPELAVLAQQDLGSPGEPVRWITDRTSSLVSADR